VAKAPDACRRRPGEAREAAAEPGSLERRGRVPGFRDIAAMRQGKDRAAPDDLAANGSRLSLASLGRPG